MTPVGVFFIAFFPLVIMIRHFVNSPNLSQSGMGEKNPQGERLCGLCIAVVADKIYFFLTLHRIPFCVTMPVIPFSHSFCRESNTLRKKAKIFVTQDQMSLHLPRNLLYGTENSDSKYSIHPWSANFISPARSSLRLSLHSKIALPPWGDVLATAFDP